MYKDTGAYWPPMLYRFNPTIGRDGLMIFPIRLQGRF
jgi:hypothetical protein